MNTIIAYQPSGYGRVFRELNNNNIPDLMVHFNGNGEIKCAFSPADIVAKWIIKLKNL